MKTEFDLIRGLLSRTTKIKPADSKVKIGIGDDCAVFAAGSKTDLVITADLLIEDIDFRLSWTQPEFIGHKALAVSLSDIAAMGAKPLWGLVSIGVPEKLWKTDFVEQFYEGWFALAKKYNVELVGGDVSRSPDKIVIDSIVAGEAKKNRAVLRSGARVGDLIYVTGKLGGGAAGLRLLESGISYQTAENRQKNMIRQQLTPVPQIEIGLKLAETKLAAAMIDLSDGLSSDLAHLCGSSGTGAEIYGEQIPLDLKNVLNKNDDALSLALDGGEDFELLFAIRPRNRNKLERELGEKATLIGKMTDTGIIELISKGKKVAIKAQGFRHF